MIGSLLSRRQQTIRIGLAWLLPVAAGLLYWLFPLQLMPYPWLLFYPAAFFAALIAGLWGGIGATVISSVLVWYFLLPPYFSLASDNPGSWLAILIFTGTGIIFSIFHQALRKNYEQYHMLFDHAGEGIIRVTAQGELADANARFAAMAGRMPRELIGCPVADLFPGLSPKLWRETEKELIAAGSVSLERQMRGASGEILPIAVTITPLHSGGWLAIIRDIGARKRAELALQESEAKWRMVFNLLPVGVSIVDNRNNVSDTNPALSDILDITETGILAGAYRNRRYFHADLTPMQSGEFPSQRAIREHQTIQNVEIGIEKEDGAFIWTSVSSTPVMDSGYSATVTVDITERKRAEQALRVSEEKFAGFFRSSPIPLSVSRLDTGELREINDAYTRTFGYTREDVIGRTSMQLELFSTEERQAAVHILQERGEVINFPFAVRCKGGEVKECLSSIIVVDLPEGRYVLSAIVDISTLKRLDAAVRVSQERLMALIENSSEPIWSVDREYRLLVANSTFDRGMQEQYGRPFALGECVLDDPFPPHVRPLWQQLYDRALAGEAFTVEMPSILRPGGKVECHFHPIRAADGAITGVAGRSTDITERLEAERQLRELLAQLKLATDAAEVGIWNWEFAGDRLEWDERMAGFYEMPADLRQRGLYYDFWRSRLHPDDQVEVESSLLAARASGGAWSRTFRIVLPGGRIRYLQSACVTELDRGGRPLRMVGVNRDITQQRALERLLQESNSELERQVAAATAGLRTTVEELRRANAGKDAFLAAISHELRTPLMGVLSMSELLASQERGALNPKQAGYVNAITESGERLLATLNNVLLYTQVMAGTAPIHREPCLLADVCTVAMRGAVPKAEARQQQITQAVEPVGLQIESDFQALVNVLKMLLDNAVKFTPKGGSITLRAGPAEGAGAVFLRVTDSGIGMTPEEIAGLFEPLSQADKSLARRYEGLGIGLAYVHAVVARLGGAVTVESQPGEGSCFTVTLPGVTG